MKSSIALLASLLAASTVVGLAQTAPAPSAPAGPAKVVVISFQAVVGSTNEFQRDFGDLQKKFEPKRTQLKTLSDEIDSLNKQLQSEGDKLSEAERSSRSKTLAEKQKAAQRLAEDAQNDFQQQMQQLFGGVAGKVGAVLDSYAKEQGYTLVVDTTEQQQQAPVVVWAAPGIDISKAIVDAYNVKSGVPAPPAAPRPTASAPASH